MGIPTLPFAPPTPPAPPSFGGGGSGYQQNPYTQPKQPALAADVVKGINDFVGSYLAAKQGRKQQARQELMDGMALKAAGIPTNDEHLAKLVKRSGLPIRTEEYTPEEQQQQAQAKQIEAQNTMLAQSQANPAIGAINPMAAAGMSGMGPQPVPDLSGQQNSPTDTRNIMQKFLGMGQKPASTNSPAGEWLRQYGQAAGPQGLVPQLNRTNKFQKLEDHLKENGLDLSKLTMDQQKQLIAVGNAALGGDPKAVEMFSRFVSAGQGKNLPGDEFAMALRHANPSVPEEKINQAAGTLMLRGLTGAPQLDLKMLEMAKDTAKYYGGDIMKAMSHMQDPTNPSLMPNLPPEEVDKVFESIKKIHDQYPSAPENLVRGYAESLSQPNGKELAAAYAKTLDSHYKNKGDIEAQKTMFSQTNELNHLNIDQGSLALRMETERRDLDLKTANTIFDAAGKEGEWARKVYEDPKASDQQISDARQIMVSAMNKQSHLTVKYGGKSFTLADPVKSVDQLKRFRAIYTGGLSTLGDWGYDKSIGLQGPPPGLIGEPSAPSGPGSTTGQHPPMPNPLQRIQRTFQDIEDPELKKMLLKNSDPTGHILDFLKQMGQ